MEMQLDRKAGEMLKADLEKQGMKIELQANSKEIIGDKDVEAIKLADGRVIETPALRSNCISMSQSAK
jgi:nitrite reductase (NADH) large subunit